MTKYKGHININPQKYENENHRKGRVAEEKVLQHLLSYLPDDTSVIALPQIGKLDPDIIVASPRYGFRIVEVKNWKLSSIRDAHTNGTIIIGNFTPRNPMNQAKKHAEGLMHYLESDFFKHFNGNSPVGYVVIHIGFSKEEFIRRFPIFQQESEYWIHHLCIDDLTSDIDNKLAIAAKRSYRVKENVIEQVLRTIHIREPDITEEEIKIDEIERKMSELDFKIEETGELIAKLTPSINNSALIQKNGKKKFTTFAYLLIPLIIVLVVITLFINSQNKNSSNVTTNEIWQPTIQAILNAKEENR